MISSFSQEQFQQFYEFSGGGGGGGDNRKVPFWFCVSDTITISSAYNKELIFHVPSSTPWGKGLGQAQCLDHSKTERNGVDLRLHPAVRIFYKQNNSLI